MVVLQVKEFELKAVDPTGKLVSLGKVFNDSPRFWSWVDDYFDQARRIDAREIVFVEHKGYWDVYARCEDVSKLSRLEP